MSCIYYRYVMRPSLRYIDVCEILSVGCSSCFLAQLYDLVTTLVVGGVDEILNDARSFRTRHHTCYTHSLSFSHCPSPSRSRTHSGLPRTHIRKFIKDSRLTSPCPLEPPSPPPQIPVNSHRSQYQPRTLQE